MFPLLSYLRGHVITESMYIAFITKDKMNQDDVNRTNLIQNRHHKTTNDHHCYFIKME